MVITPARDATAGVPGKGAPATERATAHPAGWRLAARLHYASLLLAYPALLWLGRDMWFRLDEWRIVLGHQPIARLWDVFAPFDIHWATIPVLYYHAVGAFAGAASYLPYVGVAVAVYVLDAHLAWRVLRRCGVDPWVASLSAAALLVVGVGWESMYWVLIVGYTVPIALTFGAVLVADGEEFGARHRVGIAVLTVLSVMCSGAGVAMLIVPGIVIALRRGVRWGVYGIAPAAIVYLVWLDVAGRGVLDHPGGASRGMAGTVLHFAWDGMSASVGAFVGPTVLGVVALIALAGWMGAPWRLRGMPAAVPACAAGAVAVFVLAALGRANGGVADTPHYLATGAALLLPAAALAATDALSLLRRRPLVARAVVTVGLLVVIGHGASDLVSATAAATRESQESRQVLVAAAALSADGTALPDSYPENHLGWAVSVADLERLSRSGELRPPASLPADVVAEVRLHIHVAFSTQPVTTVVPAVVEAARGASLSEDGGCTIAHGDGPAPFTVALRFDGTAALRLVADTALGVETYIRGSVDTPSDLAHTAEFLSSGSIRYVNDVEPGSAVFLRVSPGTVRLCP